MIHQCTGSLADGGMTLIEDLAERFRSEIVNVDVTVVWIWVWYGMGHGVLKHIW